jgi:LacI family transcriptional regulator
MVYLTHESSESETSILQDLRNGRVDGILVSVSGGVKPDSAVHTQLAKEMPLIFFDRVCDAVPTAKVLTDDFDAAYKATCHLISRGCKEIVFLSAAGDLSITGERRKGFIRALAENNIVAKEHHVLVCSENEDESLDAIRQVLKGKRKVDRVIGSVEKLAMQAYAVCHASGLSIPNDVKVLAFSNLQIASLLAPPLTTVVQPAFEMGKAAATLLFKALTKKVDLQSERVILPSTLYERDSTAFTAGK